MLLLLIFVKVYICGGCQGAVVREEHTKQKTLTPPLSFFLIIDPRSVFFYFLYSITILSSGFLAFTIYRCVLSTKRLVEMGEEFCGRRRCGSVILSLLTTAAKKQKLIVGVLCGHVDIMDFGFFEAYFISQWKNFSDGPGFGPPLRGYNKP